jgi:hypothetical protein
MPLKCRQLYLKALCLPLRPGKSKPVHTVTSRGCSKSFRRSKSRQYIASYSRSVMSCLSDRPSPPDTSPCSPQQPYGSKLHLSRSRFRLPSPFPADRRAPLLSPIWLLGCPSVQTRLGRRGRKYHNRCSCWSQLYCQGGSRCCQCQSV